LGAGQSAPASLQCTYVTAPTGIAPVDNASLIQAALRLNNSVTVFFTVPVFLHIFFSPDGRLEKEDYLPRWRGIASETSEELPSIFTTSVPDIQQKLEANRVFFVAQRNVEGHDVLYASSKTADGSVFLMEIVISAQRTCKLCIKTQSTGLVPALIQSMKLILGPTEERTQFL